MASGAPISAAVEGIVDEAVVRRLIAHAGGVIGDVYGKQGKECLRHKMGGYNNAARRRPWVVLIDLDSEHTCAPPLVAAWVADPAPHLCFRVAVHEIEAWLLADKDQLAAFLGIARTMIPDKPEALTDPKGAMVNLARHSRRPAIRRDMLPHAGSGRPVGRAYASRLMEFAASSWRPEIAAERSASLRRAIDCLKRLLRTPVGQAAGV